jgi:hypothetical protein
MSATDQAAPAALEPLFVDKKTAAQLLGNISLRKLNELMYAGRINPQMIDGRTVFAPAELRRFAAECPSWEPRS